jgi:V/A-type H+-transporting ATPase subunit A
VSAPGRIVRATGALVEARPLRGAALYELARVGERGLLGEVVRLEDETATLQVYEDTAGLSLGEPVELTGSSLTVHLGPGLLGSVLDGVGRPLCRMAEAAGDFIAPGLAAATLDGERRWRFEPRVKAGDRVGPGDVLGAVEETPSVRHLVMVPPDAGGAVAALAGGDFTVDEAIGELADGTPLALSHRWPVRRPRPAAERLAGHQPFVTGQRVFDFLFPVAEGGTVALPGGFGTGKTLIEQSLAKFAEADVVVYVGCGERGNEMAEVLSELPRLADPRTGRSILERTVLIVNTSNMPVAAREASVYLGLTIAEHYRDMGCRVAVMADSLSRWAEALREMGARLQEMPGEEGYPTYLASRLGKIFERAGRVRALGRPERTGALTLINAISPPGGDFSEPVTQAALRVAGALWGLEAALAHQRQFPAVDWETSYSLYADAVLPRLAERTGRDWGAVRRDTLALLAREGELREIAGLVGTESLQDRDRLLLEAARAVREAVLFQSAYDPADAYSPLAKTWRLASLAHALHRAGLAALESGVPFERIAIAPARQALASLRTAPAGDFEAAAARVEAMVARLAPAGAVP